MSLLTDLTAEILDTVDSPDIVEAIVLARITEGMKYISARANIPEFETYDNVTVLTDDSSVSLPDDYQRGLFYCRDTGTESDIPIKSSSVRARMTYYEDRDQVCAVSAAGTLLLAEDVDSDTVLEVGYYRNPIVTEVDALPIGHDDVIFNYCCWKLFSKLEDGDDGHKTNTNYYKGLFKDDLKDLRTKLQESQPEARPPRSNGWI